MTTTICNERMILLSDKAIYLPDHGMLLIADLHFGKIEHFRKNGIALPPSAARRDIAKLSKLIAKSPAQKIIFMGDLFHSDYNDAWLAFKEMIGAYPDRTFHLIVGNHDILHVDLYDGMVISHEMEVNNLVLTHEPLDVIMDGKYNLCGHIHPGVRLRGRGMQSVRVPCFYFGKYTGILPSFGTFTGTHILRPIKGDKVFVVQDDEVIEV